MIQLLVFGLNWHEPKFYTCKIEQMQQNNILKKKKKVKVGRERTWFAGNRRGGHVTDWCIDVSRYQFCTTQHRVGFENRRIGFSLEPLNTHFFPLPSITFCLSSDLSFFIFAPNPSHLPLVPFDFHGPKTAHFKVPREADSDLDTWHRQPFD